MSEQRPVCVHANTPAPLGRPYPIPEDMGPHYGCDGNFMKPGTVVRASFHGTLHPVTKAIGRALTDSASDGVWMQEENQ